MNYKTKIDSLEKSIQESRKHIQADSYSMSIGELANLYKENEIDIHPEFQRFYRWTDVQKSKLIDSILLGLPLPSFFVAQNDHGIWEVIDGLQRIATILSFMGLYKNKDGDIAIPLKLTKTQYLPELDGFVWDEDASQKNEGAPYFSQEMRLSFKREKIELKIIKKESSKETKYELFNRLNTAGSALSNQEVRNCMLIMLDKNFYDWLSNLSNDNNFIETIDLSEKSLSESYETELVLRFFIFNKKNMNEVKNIIDVGDYITEKMQSELLISSFEKDNALSNFKNTFSILNKALGDSAFKKYSKESSKYKGAFSLPIFEVMALGLGKNIANFSIENNEDIEKIRSISKDLPNNKVFIENSGSGANISKRLPNLISLGQQLFSKND